MAKQRECHRLIHKNMMDIDPFMARLLDFEGTMKKQREPRRCGVFPFL
jgi:hypothetical protein